MIIDKTEKEFNGIPKTLEGEVLLKKDVDEDGNIKGYLTATIETVKNMKGKTDAQLEEMGWMGYKDIIEGIDIASFNYQEKIKNEQNINIPGRR